MSDNSKTTVTMVGAGMGGYYLVAFLGNAGYTVRLHDIDDAKLAEARTAGGIDVEGVGFAKLDLVTTDVRAAADGADIIIVVTGGNFHESAARSLAPVLRDGQTVLLIQGNTGGSLVFRRTLKAAGCKATIDVAEMDNYPYSCWKRGPGKIAPIITKRFLQIASFPGNRSDAVFAKLSPLFPTAVSAPNVFYTGFMNANAMLHVANCVGNAGRIDAGGDYKFYAEGVTPLVANLYEAINAERVAVAAAYGANVPNLADWFDRTYGVRGRTLVERAQALSYDKDGPYQATGTPKSFAHKYISEDVPVGLIPMSALGKAAGVPTPAIDSLIGIAGFMGGTDFARDARTLDRMGLAGMDKAGIKRVFEQGFA